MTQLERIRYFESLLDRLTETEARLEGALDAFAALPPLVRELEGYYTGEDWRRDFEADEAGLLPPELKRGVLSEDAAYDALESYRGLLIRMLETVTDTMKN